MNEDIKKRIEEAAELELGDHCWPFIRGTEFMLALVLEVLESDEAKNTWHSADAWAMELRERFGVQKK